MNRSIINALLSPVFSTIQPTLFPQTGHAVYRDPKTGHECLVVESPQSMANRLEEIALQPNSLDYALAELLTGLPYVAIRNKLDSKLLGTTVTLPHRIGTGYIAKHKESELGKNLIAEINANGLYLTLFKYDPLSIIHGVFLSHLDSGKNKVTRCLTGRVEATNVVAVPVGGASKDPISASSDKWQLKDYFIEATNTTKGSSLGMGNLPYYQEEYACERITATFSIDRNLVLATGLPEVAQQLLLAIAEWKVLKFLDGSIRLRTSEYECGEIEKHNSDATLESLESEIPQLIAECQAEKLFAAPAVTEVSITLKEKTPESKSSKKPRSKAAKGGGK